MKMGPQRAVAGVRTLEPEVGSGQSIHAIRSSSLTDVLLFFQRHHALDAHTTNFHSTAISQIPIFEFISSYFFSFFFPSQGTGIKQQYQKIWLINKMF